jgi:hypothetical protein
VGAELGFRVGVHIGSDPVTRVCIEFLVTVPASVFTSTPLPSTAFFTPLLMNSVTQRRRAREKAAF